MLTQESQVCKSTVFCHWNEKKEKERDRSKLSYDVFAFQSVNMHNISICFWLPQDIPWDSYDEINQFGKTWCDMHIVRR